MRTDLPSDELVANATGLVRHRILQAVAESARAVLVDRQLRQSSPTWRAAMVGKSLVGAHPSSPAQWYDRPGGGLGVLSIPDPDRLPPVLVGESRAGADTPERRRWAYLATRLAELKPDVADLLARYQEPPPDPIRVVVPWYLFADLLTDAGIDPEPGMERWPCGSL